MSRVDVAASDEVIEGKLTSVEASGERILLTRVAGRARAFQNRCPHLGLPLAKGRLDGQTIRCPWHGSRFDMCTGENLDWVNAFVGIPLPAFARPLVSFGKRPAPIVTYPVVESGGRVHVEI
jgi:nitrite reductase/ring-hydroxylating ferredoxin subunit